MTDAFHSVAKTRSYPLRRSVVIVSAATLICVGVAGGSRVALGFSSGPTARAWGLEPRTLGNTRPRIAHPKGTHTLTVTAKNFTATQIDNPPSGLSQGDEIIVNGQLFSNHQLAGQLEAREVLTDAASGRLLLDFTVLLAGGQITGSAVARLSAAPVRGAILGGNGAYATIRGVMYAYSTGSTTQLTFVYSNR